jgi:putative MATE family efflux protein
MVEMVKSDLTVGSIPEHFYRLALPMAIGMVFYTLYNMVGIYFAGKLSTSAQAGIGIGHLVYFFLIAFGFGLNAAMAGLVGNSLGEKKISEAKVLVAKGISLAIVISIGLIVFGILCGSSIINLVSETGSYREYSVRYFLVLLSALPAFLISYTCNGALQAQGDSISMQRALVAAFFLIIIITPILIFGVPNLWLGIGFDGIALSVVISQFLVMVFLLIKVKRSVLGLHLTLKASLTNFRFYYEIIKQMIPGCMSFQMVIIGSLVVQFALKGFGPHALAGYNIGLRIEQLLLLPILGMTQALLPIVAQNYGAKNFHRVRLALYYCCSAGFVMMIIVYPIIWIFGESALRVFTSNLEVVDVGVSYLRIDGLILPLYAILFSVNSFLQGVKRPASIFWIGFFRQGLLTAFFIWIFIGVLGSDIWGVWVGAGVSVFFGWGLSIFIAYKIANKEIGGLWQKSQI